MKTFLVIFLLSVFTFSSQAQDAPTAPGIATIKLYHPGDQTSFPLVTLGALQGLELHFDDLTNRIRNYYYTYQLCNADWTPSMLHAFEYIKGFETVRISNYRNSSIATIPYVHYQATLPERNSYPSKAGNYLLKIFLDNDTSKLVFTRRMVVLNNKTTVTAAVGEPFNASLYRTGQKLNISVKTDASIQVLSPSDIKVVILQNNSWRTAFTLDRPTIYRGNYYEYTDEAITGFPAGKEFRWIDLRSLRLKSDRMQDLNNKLDTTQVWVRPDPNRSGERYVYYKDLNGGYTVETLESINPFWQGDYAEVHFSYFPAGNRAVQGSDLYMIGEMTNYGLDTSGRMHFNPERGAYEKTLLLKQGFYNYLYGTLPASGVGFPDFSVTEGNYFATENNYLILVYYRPFGARADELIGSAIANSYRRL